MTDHYNYALNVLVTHCWQQLAVHDLLSFSQLCLELNQLLTPVKQNSLVYRIPKDKHITTFKSPKNVIVQSKLSIPLQPKALTFDDDFNQFVDDLPSSILSLTFQWDFDQEVDSLPLSLSRLSFGANFDHPVDHLPLFLSHLSFGYRFNRSVDHLPPSISRLSFGESFNQPVNHLPSSLSHLSFGHFFNRPINHLPNSITHLSLGYLFQENDSEFEFPPNLIELSFSNPRFPIHSIKSKLPPSLKKLTVGGVSVVV